MVEYLGRGADLAERQRVEPLQLGRLLLSHPFQVEQEDRLVELSEYMLQRAGCRSREFKGPETVFPGRIGALAGCEADGEVAVPE